ncbi:hypothetical protein LCGC14_1537050 [marine sediment metagenome]|uniref:Tyrosine recombinase XerC n=1 Tax=marine sediment metagenome TaxID=412755 RepID=A0A0F9IU94_9ZZZZ
MSDAPKIIKSFLFYLEHSRQYSKHTLVSYRTDLKQFLNHLWSQIDFNLFPTGITQKDIRFYLAHLRNKGFSEATVSRKLASLRSLYRWMLREKMVDQNPTRGFASPRPDKPPLRVLDEWQVESLMITANVQSLWGQRDRVILELLYSTGIKIGELAGLNWQEVDLFEQCIHIEGRASRKRSLVLSVGAYQAVQEYWKILSGARKSRKFDPDAVLVNRRNGRLSDRSISRVVEKYVKRANLPEWVSPQTLRHSFATHMLDRGANVEDIQAILGHQSVETTKIYTKMREKGVLSPNPGS